jgi:hypothetical protein
LGEYGAKNVYTLCVSAKMIPVETIPGMKEGGDKKEQWRK